MLNFPIELEVAGPLAMFARPDAGASPTSYPVPTFSAAKGILESIAFFADGAAFMKPTRIEICRQRGQRGGTVYQRYAFNYGGPLRKDLNVKNGTGMQVFATAIANACFRIHAEIRSAAPPRGGRNPAHHLKDLFDRRLKQGRCHRTPCLGWSEFTCDYWGPFREETEVDESLSMTIPSMLDEMWDRPTGGAYVSRFRQNVRIEAGALSYAE